MTLTKVCLSYVKRTAISGSSEKPKTYLAEEPELGRSRGKKKGKLTRTRKTRGMLADKQKGPKSFAVMLEEVTGVSEESKLCSVRGPTEHLLQAELDQLPPEVPTYLTAAVGPSRTASARKWCSVCSNPSP